MIVKVPANIPYEEIFHKWERLRIDKKTNLKNTVYIILDYMVDDNGINSLWYDSVGLSSPKFKKICSENFFIVKRELIHRGILKQNTISGKYEVGVTPEKYNLDFKYCNSGLLDVHLPESTTATNYKLFKQNGYLQKINLNEGKDVKHLEDQFENLAIEILPEIHDFKSFYQERMHYHLLDKWKRKSIRYLILSKIGQMEQNISDLYARQYNPTLSPQNLRFHSLFTNMIKELRSFIRINGNQLVEFDLKSSNLYVLATILNYEFFTDEKGKYNLFKIFRKLHIKLQNLKEAKEKESTTESRAGARGRRIPYLCPTFFDNVDLKLFKQVSYEQGFYEQLIDLVKTDHPDLLNRYPSLGNRDAVKKMVLSYLTDTEKKHRKNMSIVELMNKVYPSISDFVSSNLVFRNFRSPMAFLLQRAESYLVLDLVAKELIKSYPDSKLITIHDCFLIEDAGLDRDEVVIKIKQVLFNFTGITPGVSVKVPTLNHDVHEIVDKTIKKLQRRSRVKENLNDPIEKRLFSPLIINQVEKGICFLFDGQEQAKALKEFNDFIEKRYLN